MEFIKALLSETSGISSMRFMALSSLFFSFILCVYGVVESKDVFNYVIMFSGFAFGGKVAQKIQETKTV